MLRIGKFALFSFLSVLVLAFQTSAAPAPQSASSPEYQLAVSFSPALNQLSGTAVITIAAGETLSLHTGSLKITGILLKRQDGSSSEAGVPDQPFFTVQADNEQRQLYISYTKSVKDDASNRISPDGIVLLDGWHPVPNRKMQYQLTATLPEGFTAVTESDVFPLNRQGRTITATFGEPVFGLHFAAAPYAVSSLQVRDGLTVHALFFPEDSQLAPEYLNKSQEYIQRYEREIGPFPYNHYVIAANRLPTGLGMPTFTLLGQSVLRLPFIKDTSLGHEILHSWFGNSIDIDLRYGNWCEGLTSYLADHAYRQEMGEGAAYRKEAIVNYLSYVHPDNVIPLTQFIDGNHLQPQEKARRAIGYSRSLMLFHELRQRIGDDRFNSGIRSFYKTFRSKTASWEDIRNIFNKEAGEDLTSFFTERLTRTDIPSLQVDNISIAQENEKSVLKFRLIQKTAQPYSLRVPVTVNTGQGEFSFMTATDSPEKDVTLPLPGRPLSFTLDPDYSFLRQLNAEENPAAWSRFLGAEKKLVIFESEAAENVFRTLIASLSNHNLIIKYDNQVGNRELAENDLLILGLGQQASRSLFGRPPHPHQGFTLDVRTNPLNPAHTAVLVSSDNEQETAAVASRLSHYGKYSYLHFEGGRLIDKRTPEGASGQGYVIEELPLGGSTAPLRDFHAIADELSRHDVIYIGENHTAVSDHRLQLRLIEALSRRIPDLAIGMEMFPSSSQQALDAYILQDPAMSEKEFLRASRYFEVWRYDYRYFHEILQFARAKKIPVIGLNLDREIVSAVYRTGSTDDLDQEARNSLPEERDLDMQGYTDRLQAVHNMHEQGNHGNGRISGFIQAQAIWDETMAENIANHLKAHPGRKMIVLAGAQHTRKDSGIPPRVARRLEVRQASVLNLLSGSAPANLREVADFYFLSEAAEFDEPPKMGIVLEERADTDRKYLEITDFSPQSKADEAGLLKGDILLAINGYPVQTMEDIRISMFDLKPEDSVEVDVQRKDEDGLKTERFTVELIRLQAKPHP